MFHMVSAFFLLSVLAFLNTTYQASLDLWLQPQPLPFSQLLSLLVASLLLLSK